MAPGVTQGCCGVPIACPLGRDDEHDCDSAWAICRAIARSVRDVSNSRDLGARGEQLAAEHLTRRGFQILERNYRTRWGELDIIAFDGCTLAFCEVKTRRLADGVTHPFDALRSAKQSRIRQVARRWLRERTPRPYAPVLRFDAIGVTFDLAGQLLGIEHLEGAF
jgi:putative endonuclease